MYIYAPLFTPLLPLPVQSSPEEIATPEKRIELSHVRFDDMMDSCVDVLHAHVCVCVCVCVTGDSMDQSTASTRNSLGPVFQGFWLEVTRRMCVEKKPKNITTSIQQSCDWNSGLQRGSGFGVQVNTTIRDWKFRSMKGCQMRILRP
jgi:hypothetical protein